MHGLKRWTAFLAGCGALALLACSPAGRPRLVVLIVIDTLRADHLGCYGYGRIHTPHLDSLATAGTLYENALTVAPITLPAVASLLTGTYPLQHGLRDNGGYRLNDAWETLAERLRAAGFATGAFVSSEVLASARNLGQGFEVYDDDLSAPMKFYDPKLQRLEQVRQGVERRADQTVDRALAWLAGVAGRDAFLCVHLFDPHVPRDPPPPFDADYPGHPYDGEIAFTDREIGRLLAGAAHHWRPEQILTVAVGDHGEGLRDHEEELHGVLLFEETVRVPLIVSGPRVPRGQRVAAVVRTVDVTPTLCALAGLDAPAESPGTTLPGLRTDRRAAGERRGAAAVAYLETLRPRLAHDWCELRALRTDAWKLIEGPEVELYDLRGDPHERHDAAAAHPAVRDSLLRMLDETAFASFARGAHPAGAAELTDAEREHLMSLGYVSGPVAAPSAGSDSLAVWGFPPDQRGRVLGLPDPRPGLLAYNDRLAARSYTKAGGAAYRAGDFDRASELFGEAIAADESFADAHLGLACARERAGHLAEAIALLRRAHETFPDHEPITVALARALLAGGWDQEAREVIVAALADPSTSAATIAELEGLRAGQPDAGP